MNNRKEWRSIKKLKRNELREIEGGFSITGSIVNAFVEGIKTILDVGRSLGSSLRRLKEDKLCKVS